MQAQLFGLAEVDEKTGEPDPERVRIWGMETPDGAVLYWRDIDRRNQFIIADSAASAAARFGPIFALALVHP